MKKNTLGPVVRAAILALVVGVLAACGNDFHNGTNMVIQSVKIYGLPSTYYGKQLVFSYAGGGGGGKWVHDVPAEFTSAKFKATVDNSGNYVLTLSPTITYTDATLQFILIDPNKNWDTYQVDKKHSGRKGGDVILDNQWTGSASPLSVVGTVKGEDVDWTFQ